MKMADVVFTVGILVFKERSVLLVKHTEASRNVTGIYGLPAGHIEAGETEAEAAARELFEETGLRTRIKDLIPFPVPYFGEITGKTGPRIYSWRVFRAMRHEGDLRSSIETLPEWVAIADLAQYHLLPDVLAAVKDGLLITHRF